MQGLVSGRLAADWPAVSFHPGDLDWWALLANPRFPPLTERVRLWFDDSGALVGFVWFSPPCELDFIVERPARAVPTLDLIREMVSWASRLRVPAEGADVEPLRLWVAAAGGPAMGAATDLGFTPDRRPGLVQFTGDLDIADAWPPSALADGLALRPLETDPHIEACSPAGGLRFRRRS